MLFFIHHQGVLGKTYGKATQGIIELLTAKMDESELQQLQAELEKNKYESVVSLCVFVCLFVCLFVCCYCNTFVSDAMPLIII